MRYDVLKLTARLGGCENAGIILPRVESLSASSQAHLLIGKYGIIPRVIYDIPRVIFAKVHLS